MTATEVRHRPSAPGGPAAAEWARSWATPIVLFLALTAVAVPVAAVSNGLRATVIVAIINVVLTVGLYVFVGNCGVYSFGQLGFAVVGAYVGSLAAMPATLKETLLPNSPGIVRALSLPPTAAVVLGGVCAAVVAAVVAAPVSRLGGLSAGLATVSLLIAMRVLATNWSEVTKGAAGLSSNVTATDLPTVLAWALVVLLAAWAFQRSSWGRQLRATKADEVAAAAAGINTARLRGVAFIVSGFISGVGGALFAMLNGSVSPNMFYLDYTFLVIAMLVIGGADSLTGAVAGSALVSAISAVFSSVEQGSVLGLFQVPALPGIATTALGVLLVIILIVRRDGLTGGRELGLPARRITIDHEGKQR